MSKTLDQIFFTRKQNKAKPKVCMYEIIVCGVLRAQRDGVK